MDEAGSSIHVRDWSRNALGGEAEMLEGQWLPSTRGAQYPLLETRNTWLVVGGRGSGKTRLGAEWVNALVRGFPPFTRRSLRYGRLALVGETLGDVREVMIEGASGLAGIGRQDRPHYESSRRRLLWENGAVAQVFSSEDPDSLRGPQFEAAWCDEIAKWKHAEACFDMLQFGLRLGARPKQILTTTPKPTPLVKRLMADPTVHITTMRTAENAANLAQDFLAQMKRRYEGSRLGRQELEGELIEDRAGALWTRDTIAAARQRRHGSIGRIVVAVDPPSGAGKASRCGIVAAGLDDEGCGVVLADMTVTAGEPSAWAGAAVSLYRRMAADCILAEINQGGAMVESVLRTVDATIPVKTVRATRGKWLRAEPVAALYAQGRVAHAEHFPALEDEMCDFGPEGLSGGRSPDRVDALVWALSELMLGQNGEPRIRQMR